MEKYLYTYIAIIVLAAVFLLIALRQVFQGRVRIWQIMLAGAIVVLVLGQISLPDAASAINPEVMVFLFSMFVIGEAMARSGYLDGVARFLFSRARTTGELVVVLLVGFGALSAFLMNDTLAIIGTPLVLGIAGRSRIPVKLMLLALAFAITTGSVASPIGNPQNLLVAVGSGMHAPFVTFAIWLLIPTFAGLGVAALVLFLVYRKDWTVPVAWEPDPADQKDPALGLVVRVSLVILIGLSAANIVVSLVTGAFAFPLVYIGVAAALPVLAFSAKRWEVLRAVDWPTLIFFAALFVLMAAVWQTGFFQDLSATAGVSSVPAILGTSVIVSQFISNVPFVALFQPLIIGAGGGTARLMALAAGSTIAGNLTILGAASNVIIVQQAEARGETLTFTDFAKIGIPVTILQMVIYVTFLMLF